jgi:hypothetical protein
MGQRSQSGYCLIYIKLMGVEVYGLWGVFMPLGALLSFSIVLQHLWRRLTEHV